MCGRFTLTIEPADLEEAFPDVIFPSQGAPRYNVTPGQPILAIPNDGSMKASFFIWGLIPSWAKDASIGSRMINARAETLAEKPSFRAAFKYHRCLIPADGFYEWQARVGSKSKLPHYIQMKSHQPFAFAGLYETWHSPDGSEIKSATIITTQPNELMAVIHNRMPVILAPKDYSRWIDPSSQLPNQLEHLLVPYAAEDMKAYPVGMLVNNPANDNPECLLPSTML
jgi:putative SOS response-associated peptidase YedK